MFSHLQCSKIMCLYQLNMQLWGSCYMINYRKLYCWLPRIIELHFQAGNYSKGRQSGGRWLKIYCNIFHIWYVTSDNLIVEWSNIFKQKVSQCPADFNQMLMRIWFCYKQNVSQYSGTYHSNADKIILSNLTNSLWAWRHLPFPCLLFTRACYCFWTECKSASHWPFQLVADKSMLCILNSLWVSVWQAFPTCCWQEYALGFEQDVSQHWAGPFCLLLTGCSAF